MSNVPISPEQRLERHDHEWRTVVANITRPDGTVSRGLAVCECGAEIDPYWGDSPISIYDPTPAEPTGWLSE